MAEVNENRLTLNEMHLSYDTEVYSYMREKLGATIEWHDRYNSEGKRDIMEAHVEMVGNWYSPNAPLLYRHIIAEQLLEDFRNVDWYEVTKYTPRTILLIAELWMHPLVDCTGEMITQLAIEGNIAKEEFAPDRKEEIREVLEFIFRKRVLWFADHPLELDSDALFLGMTKGMWMWFFLTQGYEDLIEKVLNGDHLEKSDRAECEPFNTFVLRDNLNYIAQERDGATAARLLRKLQEQWAKIKMWNACGLDEMNEQDVAQFEQTLFHGYDDLLAEWEKDKAEEVEKPTGKPDGSFFSVSDKMSYEMCEKELIRVINGAKNKSAACREILRSETIGYFVLSDKTDQEKADAINPWVTFTNKKYVFTGDDFRKARNS